MGAVREEHEHPAGAEHPQSDTLNTSGHELCARPIFHHEVKNCSSHERKAPSLDPMKTIFWFHALLQKYTKILEKGSMF